MIKHLHSSKPVHFGRIWYLNFVFESEAILRACKIVSNILEILQRQAEHKYIVSLIPEMGIVNTIEGKFCHVTWMFWKRGTEDNVENDCERKCNSVQKIWQTKIYSIHEGHIVVQAFYFQLVTVGETKSSRCSQDCKSL